MAGNPKFLVGQIEGEELGGAAEYEPDILDFLPTTKSSVPAFTGDLLTGYTYYSSDTQTEANRVGHSSITYNGSDQPTSAVYTIYKNDGTTVLRTITVSYTWSGDDLTNISRTVS